MKIFAHISWFFATVIIFIAIALSIILFPILPRPIPRKISNWFIRYTTFFSTTIKGKEDLQAQMFLINHQSDIDVGVVETSTKKDLAWVAKKALFDVPFFGLAMSLPKDIEIERESKTSLVKLLRAVKDRVDKKRTVVMFPEGTRTKSGRMLPFKSGAKFVADKYQLKVQPVVLVNTLSCYDIKRFLFSPKNLTVVFMEPFVADKNNPNWLKDLRVKMQKVYDDELAIDINNR
ncbi:MAG TPA: 1-acyl-sn-glycerol-3-phosphate acyltransferase [Sulfurimonas sp.]|nr:1-acyl-sn-glycerol-3-phosphate acyltransferase [Sulfurimonas sp.]HIM76312.1 1-acyl-sn-glycerol-3-phosphate acyltransferase [Campylobacterales bacterium]